MTRNYRRDQHGPHAGFALIAVLWLLAAVATFASIFSAYALQSAAAARVPEMRLRSEAALRAGVALAALRVLAPPAPARPSSGAFETRLDGATLEVTFRSESARVDLNQAPKELLAGLFAQFGAEKADAQRYAEAVIGWRRRVDANVANAEADAYRAEKRPYPPRQAPFDDALELRLVRDLPPDLVERVAPYVTVYSGRPEIDAATCDPLVLAALPGVSPDAVRDALRLREADKREALRALGAAGKYATVDPGDAYRATIRVRRPGAAPADAEVVFKPRDGGAVPFDILLWRDDLVGGGLSG